MEKNEDARTSPVILLQNTAGVLAQLQQSMLRLCVLGWHTALHGSRGAGRLSESVRLFVGADTSRHVCARTCILGDWHSLSRPLSRSVIYTSCRPNCKYCYSPLNMKSQCLVVDALSTVGSPQVTMTLSQETDPVSIGQMNKSQLSNSHFCCMRHCESFLSLEGASL